MMAGCRLHVFNFRGIAHAGIRIGRRTFLGEETLMRGQGGITVGDNVLFGPRVQVLAVNHVMTDPAKPIMDQGITARGIVIEDGCWIGAGAIVLDGVTIGRGLVHRRRRRGHPVDPAAQPGRRRARPRHPQPPRRPAAGARRPRLLRRDGRPRPLTGRGRRCASCSSPRRCRIRSTAGAGSRRTTRSTPSQAITRSTATRSSVTRRSAGMLPSWRGSARRSPCTCGREARPARRSRSPAASRAACR